MPKTGLFKSFAIRCMDLKALSQEVFITVATHLLGIFSCMDPLIVSWIKLEFQYILASLERRKIPVNSRKAVGTARL
jgi:hypothetical protein